MDDLAVFFRDMRQAEMSFRYRRQKTTKEVEDHYIRRLMRLLQAAGLGPVYRCRANDPVDLVLGEIGIEVKISTNQSKRATYYKFKLRGQRQTLNGDVLICLCVTPDDALIPYILPVSAAGDRATIEISSDPDTYTGQWSRYRDRLDLLKPSANWCNQVAGDLVQPVPIPRAAQPMLLSL